jgi:acyl-CoA oxidase
MTQRSNPQTLYEVLNSTRPAYSRMVRRFFEERWDPALSYRNEDLADCRTKTHDIVRRLLNSGLVHVDDLGRRPSEFFKFCEHAAWVDGSVAATLFAHFLIFGGSLVFLGTERHRRFIDPVSDYRIPGAFCMTEVDHGSNLAGLGTTATYDPDTQEFVVHTPSWRDAKWAIALLAFNARMVTVMAQLYLPDGTCKGLHSFLVPVRDEHGEPMPGVRLSDVDRLVGLNGVGIGNAMFDHVRIPRENLLDRYADVTPEGTYSSRTRSGADNFWAQVSPLMIERLVPFPVAAAKYAVTAAVRFGKERRQFGRRGGEERPIIEYASHQRRLVPRVAETYALAFMLERLHHEADRAMPASLPMGVQPLVAAFKAFSYEVARRIGIDSRESCSVHSFRHVNKMGRGLLDLMGFAHAAGDNTVLLQFAGRRLLEDLTGESPFSDPDEPDLSVLPEPIRQHGALFDARCTQLREYTRTAFAAHTAAGRSDAWNVVMTHAIELARAYALREIHRQFGRVVVRLPTGPARDLLTGWYKDLDPGPLDLTALVVENTILDASRRLAPELGLLVDGFGIPDVLLPRSDLLGDVQQKLDRPTSTPPRES